MSDERDLSQIEARLRDAIGARTGRDNVMSDDQSSLGAIEERVEAARRSLRNRRIGLSVVGLAAAIAAVAGLVTFLNKDDKSKVATDNTTTTTTTEPDHSTSTSTTVPPAPALVKAVWPFESDGVKFASAKEAAQSFAEDYLRMAQPVASEPQAGEAGATIVDVRPRPTAGVKTHVSLIEQDGGWVVLGAQADSIQVATPVEGDALAGSLHVAGQSTAFEAQINLHFRPFGSLDHVGEDTYTMGGSNGEMGPFDTTIDVPAGLTEGVLVVYEGDASGEGEVTAAAVIRLGVPARATAATSAPDRIYAWTHPTLFELDGQGNRIREVGANARALAFGDVSVSPGVGKLAWAPENSGDPGLCGQIAVTTLGAPGSSDVSRRGFHPVLSADGTLAYVSCNSDAVLVSDKEFDIVPLNATGLTWVGNDVVVAHDDQFYVIGKQGSWTGILPAGRGRYGTIAFLTADGTIASVDPKSPSKAPVPLVKPKARPVSLDADDSGAHLLWVDVNGDLWKWSGGDPVKIGSGFTSAAW